MVNMPLKGKITTLSLGARPKAINTPKVTSLRRFEDYL